MENMERIKKWEKTTMVEPQSPQFISAASPRHPWSPRNFHVNDPVGTSAFEFSCTLALDSPTVTAADQIFCNWKKVQFYPIHAENLNTAVCCGPKVPSPMEINLREEKAKGEENYCERKAPKQYVNGRNHGRGLEGLSRWLTMTELVWSGVRKTKKKETTVEVHPVCGGGAGWRPKHCHGGRRKMDEWSYM